MTPAYPIYIPSKGRAERCLTADLLVKDGVAFRLVVEQEERQAYADRYGDERMLVLPFSNQGSVIPARNWIKEHASGEGHVRHWQLDDNMRVVRRWYRGKRLPCNAAVALKVTEDFADRYENVALAGIEYQMFSAPGSVPAPFRLNTRIYSCSLILNSLPYRWRGQYNEDADLCLQVLSGGWCTVLITAFMIDKQWTMLMKGGNTDALYRHEDGRLKMARSLERMWPHVVETKRRFQRPQHVVRGAWKKFDTPLVRKSDIDWDALKGTTNEYGMKLKQVAAEVKSPELRRLLAEHT